MSYASSNTTNNIAEYWGLVYSLGQAKASGDLPLYVIGDSALVLSQLRTRHPPRQQRLVQLFNEASVVLKDITVSSWIHNYRTYNNMADQLANISMDTGNSVQAHASSNHGLLQMATTFLDSDVNYWLETCRTDKYVIKSPILPPRNMILSRQEAARRRYAVRDLVLLSI